MKVDALFGREAAVILSLPPPACGDFGHDIG